MNPILHDRRSFLLAVAALAGASYLFASAHQPAVPLQVPELGVAQAKELIDAGALVIDVRGKEQFDYRHLPNAVFLPLSVLQTEIPAWLAASKDRPIVVYCNRGLSHGPEVTAFLQHAGFSQAANLSSGIEGWSEAGMPVIKGRA